MEKNKKIKLIKMKDILIEKDYNQLDNLLRKICYYKYNLINTNFEWINYPNYLLLFNVGICKTDIIEFNLLMVDIIKEKLKNVLCELDIELDILFTRSLLCEELKDKIDESLLNEIKEMIELINILESDHLEIKNILKNNLNIKTFLETNPIFEI